MSFSGEIMDNECAAAGAHDGMMRKEGFKTAKDCALGCVKAGGQFVLFALNKTTDQLDDRGKPVVLRGPEGNQLLAHTTVQQNNPRSIDSSVP
jgi:hypothetical protein